MNLLLFLPIDHHRGNQAVLPKAQIGRDLLQSIKELGEGRFRIHAKVLLRALPIPVHAALDLVAALLETVCASFRAIIGDAVLCLRKAGKLLDGLEDAGKGLVIIGVLLAGAQVLVSMINLTGIGVTLSS
ncbi:MAG: hypothetical protein QGF00_33090, partial [Planctomycetota bacterium]|nr:hypothetical protein [Planctomycetota bacterium]